VCDADGVVVTPVVPSPNAHRNVQPVSGGASVPLNVTVATPGPAHPLTVAVRPTTVGHAPQGGIVTWMASFVTQGLPVWLGQLTMTLAVNVAAIVYTCVTVGTVVTTAGEPSPKFHV
jgi:hypothetical protein